MFLPSDYRLGEQVLEACLSRKLVLGGAESCTGGLLSALFTSIPGSSRVFSHCEVTYSYDAKINKLGVPKALLMKRGAVDGEVASIMSRRAMVDVGYGITGVAGPGFSERKPSGLVFIAVSFGEIDQVNAYRFSGDRTMVRLASVRQTLCDLLGVL